ncbi:MAG: S-layer family protein [Coleofasciculaceae cyanobacterium]
MSKKFWYFGQSWLLITLGISSILALSSNCALAQITPDGSLGVDSSVIRQNVNVRGLPAQLIEGGAARQRNLFHSFEQFNVATGERVYFANPTNIENILSRVTGNNLSQILGTLGVDGNANLFLLNPNGIVFGENARLDVRGSFVGSTANSLVFDNNVNFSASNPEASPLLTINTPIGLQFSSQTGSIRVQGTSGFRGFFSNIGLGEVQPGKTLALVGGDILLEGAFLGAPEGRIELGSVAGNGQVSLNPIAQGFALGYQDVANFGNINLSRSFVNTSVEDTSQSQSPGGGAIAIRASQLNLTETSIIRASTFTPKPGGNITIDVERLTVQEGSSIASNTFSEGLGGNITVNASESVRLIGKSPRGFFPSNISTGSSDSGGIGRGGTVTINTRQLIVRDGAQVSASTESAANAGNIIIHATELVEVSNRSNISTQVNEPEATGDGGNLTIETGRLIVIENRAQVSTSTFGEGDGGNITIKADAVEVSRTGNITASVNPGARGDGGTLTIDTRDLSIEEGGQVAAATGGSGDGGTLLVRASGVIEVSNQALLTTQTIGSGDAGTLIIEAEQLIIENGGQIATAGFMGNGGSLNINASESVIIRGVSPVDERSPSGLFVQTLGSGNAGTLGIDTRRFVVEEGGRVLASTRGQGNAGKIAINASESVDISGIAASGFSSALLTSTSGSGRGGDIEITTSAFRLSDQAVLDARTIADGESGSIKVNANTLEVTQGGQFLTTTEGSQDAGDITLIVDEVITLAGENSGLFAITEPNSSGNGGSIFIDPKLVMIRDGATVAVDSQGTGAGGGIEIFANSLTLNNQASISAETVSNTGGNITLTVQDLLLLRHNSNISTTAGTAQGLGDGGNITIKTPDGVMAAVPEEDSNITANAFQGRGGNIDIEAKGIFGIEFRPAETELSDITASSQFGVDGRVSINQPEVDPSRGLTELPTNLVNAANLIDHSCSASAQDSSFTVTGRGGLPPNPGEVLETDTLVVNWVSLDSEEENNTQVNEIENAHSTPRQIVEAQGWVVNRQGQVVLVSQVPEVTHQGNWLNPAKCHTQSTTRPAS